MISTLVSLALWALAVVLAILAWRKSPALMSLGAKEASLEFLHIIPRLVVGIIGSGFIAALLPDDVVQSLLGRDAGIMGLVLATLAGALTPGGPAIGFALAASALKSGAALAPVIAYVVAWSVLALQRALVWEIPTMPVQAVWVRMLTSLPLPFLCALGAGLLVGR